jgi:stearoyl-CoA desaturase (delta-9 desaturase)
VNEPIRSTYFNRGTWAFWGVHLTAIVGVAVLGFSLSGLIWALSLYVARMFLVTAGYHRYFSHRTFKTSRPTQFVLALLTQTSLQRGVLWWASNHRHHHRASDTDDDLHSAKRQGFWWSHLGWFLSEKYNDTDYERVKDLARFPELRWLDRNPHLPGVALAVALLLIGGLPALVWGFFVSSVLLWHGTFTINSLSHMLGKRPFDTGDESRNSPVLALITLGEGWHNNHHRYQSSTNQGFYWWQLDITHLLLRLLSMTGLIWGLRTPPQRVLDEGRATHEPELLEPELVLDGIDG